MKVLLVIALALTTNFAFAAGKAKTAPKAGLDVVKVPAIGEVKWTGYGVGKSHGGTLNISEGSVEMKGDALVGGEFTIDMASLKTGDSPRLEGHLKSADFFDVEKQKTSTFKITSVEAIKDAKKGEPTHKINGDLTIKGKTQPQTFTATVSKDGKSWKAIAKATIADRTKYDIVYNSAQFKTASALGDKLIEDKIDVELDIRTK
jgi:polyisoprenoid-binding protein YceI